MFRQTYFEACDLLIGEVNDRFSQDFMAPVIAMENLIVKSANDEEFTEDLEKVSGSVFGKDFRHSKTETPPCYAE